MAVVPFDWGKCDVALVVSLYPARVVSGMLSNTCVASSAIHRLSLLVSVPNTSTMARGAKRRTNRDPHDALLLAQSPGSGL